MAEQFRDGNLAGIRQIGEELAQSIIKGKSFCIDPFIDHYPGKDLGYRTDAIGSRRGLVFADRSLVNGLAVLGNADGAHGEVPGGENVKQAVELDAIDRLCK